MSEETPGVYRLYRPEWVIMYATTRGPDETEADLLKRCEEVFTARFGGRVRKEDVRYTVEYRTEPWAVARLELRVPCMKGEFKYVSLAERFAAEQGFLDSVVVPGYSAEDRELRDYGTVKLA